MYDYIAAYVYISPTPYGYEHITYIYIYIPTCIDGGPGRVLHAQVF